MLDSCNRLTPAQHDGVIDECESCLNSHHVFWKLLGLEVVERHFFALVQEYSYVVDDTVAFLGRRSRSFSFVKQLEPANPLYQYKTVLSDG